MIDGRKMVALPKLGQERPGSLSVEFGFNPLPYSHPRATIIFCRYGKGKEFWDNSPELRQYTLAILMFERPIVTEIQALLWGMI